VAGRSPVMLSRLGRRTDELVTLLNERQREARGRTAAFLGALLPGLDPMALREAAGLLRDGVAVPASALDLIHPELSSTLTRIATVPERRSAIGELARHTDLALGFKQIASVRRAAAGVTPWRDHAATPHIGGHASQGGAFKPGMAGALAAGVMAAGPPVAPSEAGGMFGYGAGYDAFGDYWAFRALGAGMNGRQQRPMATRPDLTRGRLTSATEDLSALTVTGEDHTVLAFALGSRPGLVVYEVLNQPEPMTYVYRGEGAAINRALDDAGFQAAAEGLASPPPRPGVLTSALAGRVPHDARWLEQITSLLTPR
jgi:hypothetical protein